MTTELLGSILFAMSMGAGTFFSPCAYALLPGYVGYYAAEVDDGAPPLTGALVRGAAASAGVVLTLGGLSALTLQLSELVERALPVLEPLVGVILVGLGIAVFTGRGATVHVPLPKRRSSVVGFGLFGGLYAVAAAGCALPLFTAVAVDSVVRSTTRAAVTLGAYVGTVALLMLSVTIATAVGFELSTDRLAPDPGRINRIAGAVLILAGIGQLYVSF